MTILRRARHATVAAALTTGLVTAFAVMGAGRPVTSPSASVRAPAGVPAGRASRVPELAVTISDGRVAARVGEILTYLVTVRDPGSVAAPRLNITQTMSPGLVVLSASDRGAAASGRVSWSAALPAGGSRTFRVVTKVISTPASQLRLAAIACVALPGSSRPVVCAAHLDRLPAAAASTSQPGDPGTSTVAYAGTGLAVVLLGGLAAAIVARRRRASAVLTAAAASPRRSDR